MKYSPPNARFRKTGQSLLGALSQLVPTLVGIIELSHYHIVLREVAENRSVAPGCIITTCPDFSRDYRIIALSHYLARGCGK
jgi:hypothetical protein